MVYLRGGAADFEAWPDDWTWPIVAPAFDRLEQVLRPQQVSGYSLQPQVRAFFTPWKWFMLFPAGGFLLLW